ncbi:hypothetical protein [Serratia marcescens]|uniref:phage tail fiber protein n=1 Tax=Serratia marcescens TaxID=615 RepID=UPI0018D5A10A|nr:hypothetical protein [Serratia marcescens]
MKPVTAAGFGVGPIHRHDVYAQENTSFINRFNGTSANAPANVVGGVITMPMDGGPTCGYIAVSSGRAAWVGISNFSGKTIYWVSLWSSGNTTVDANGFIKKASPIVKLFRDGTCELNDETQGVATERVSEGIYRVSGTLGFNADAQWGGPDGGIEVPLDRNKQPLIWVDYEVEPTGDLLIKTYHRTHTRRRRRSPAMTFWAMTKGCRSTSLRDAGWICVLRCQCARLKKHRKQSSSCRS